MQDCWILLINNSGEVTGYDFLSADSDESALHQNEDRLAPVPLVEIWKGSHCISGRILGGVVNY